MCIAAAASAVSLISTIGGGVLSATGALRNASAQRAEANYQAEVAKNNAIVAGQNAQYATEAGEAQATQSELKDRAQAGALETSIAAGGVDVNTGSAADVRMTQREFGLLDTQTVRQNAALQAYGFRTQQTGFEAQSQLDRAQALNAMPAGLISAGGDLLSSAGTATSNWLRYQQVAAPGNVVTGGGGAASGLLPYGMGP